jgi:serine/threonine-protein kinase
MVGSCIACGRTLELGRFCPACGAEQHARGPLDDPLIGRVIADRYEVLGLINVGGMGSVYRARHRALDRLVAVKLVHPHLLSSDDVVARFMLEAQTASRFNHVNVVGIYDFGRMPLDEGGRLFLVMEHLSGPDLATVLLREGALAPPRAVGILLQMLGALGEAHQQGIVHRDIKPENVILEPRRSAELVKIIDFGIAKAVAGRRVTAEGRVMGTPVYMAPEQTVAEPPGPSVDLYASGVMLFQLLTGRLPFDGPTAEVVMSAQRVAPRPDPRAAAPDRPISAALARVCLRAIDIDPDRRFATAEAFADALREVLAHDDDAPARSSASQRTHAMRTVIAGSPVEVTPDTKRSARRSSSSSTERPAARSSPQPARARPPSSYAGRADDLAWLAARSLGPHASFGLVVWGPEGAGRTRLLEEHAAAARRAGALVHVTRGRLPPGAEASYAGVRELIGALAPPGPGEPSLASGGAADAVMEREGLRAIFASRLVAPAVSPTECRSRAASALRWALARAAEVAAPRRVLVAIDDVDRLDAITQMALAEALAGPPIAGVTVLCTLLRTPDRWAPDAVPSRRIGGLTRSDAADFAGTARLGALPEPADGFYPLHLEELAAAADEGAILGAPPRTLAETVEARVRRLSASELLLLQSASLVGRASLDDLLRVVPRREGVRGTAARLTAAGYLVETDDGALAPRHSIHARVALRLVPKATATELHARAADLLSERRAPVELCAFHAIRGRPDLDAFLMIEECARLRTQHGDDEGAIALLWDGLSIAHTQALLGEPEATEVWIAFGRKLGAALLDAERGDEAMGVLIEVLDRAGPQDLERARVLVQLAEVASQRKRLVEADARRREALDIAERMGDRALAEQLRQAIHGDASPAAVSDDQGPRPSRVQRADGAAEFALDTMREVEASERR